MEFDLVYGQRRYPNTVGLGWDLRQDGVHAVRTPKYWEMK